MILIVNLSGYICYNCMEAFASDCVVHISCLLSYLLYSYSYMRVHFKMLTIAKLYSYVYTAGTCIHAFKNCPNII